MLFVHFSFTFNFARCNPILVRTHFLTHTYMHISDTLLKSIEFSWIKCEKFVCTEKHTFFMTMKFLKLTLRLLRSKYFEVKKNARINIWKWNRSKTNFWCLQCFVFFRCESTIDEYIWPNLSNRFCCLVN